MKESMTHTTITLTAVCNHDGEEAVKAYSNQKVCLNKTMVQISRQTEISVPLIWSVEAENTLTRSTENWMKAVLHAIRQKNGVGSPWHQAGLPLPHGTLNEITVKQDGMPLWARISIKTHLRDLVALEELPNNFTKEYEEILIRAECKRSSRLNPWKLGCNAVSA